MYVSNLEYGVSLDIRNKFQISFLLLHIADNMEAV